MLLGSWIATIFKFLFTTNFCAGGFREKGTGNQTVSYYLQRFTSKKHKICRNFFLTEIVLIIASLF